jgi:ribosomal protein L3 glutamine methyltransferase
MFEALAKIDLSNNPKRNKHYQLFLAACRKKPRQLNELIHLGSRFLRKEKVYHHFFVNHSLKTIATHLAFFSLNLPYEYSNKAFLERPITEEEAKKIIVLLERRIAERIPVAYLTQEAEYLGRPFYVNEAVLVPRSLMNTRFNDFLAAIPWENYRVLDLCTGSGCIGLTLALLHPKLQVDLADISAKALEVATINRARYALEKRVRCIQSDLFENIEGKYDLIITNPPYVSDHEYQGQPPEIKNEPALALKGGRDGLDLINRILIQAKDYLNPKGILIAEVGFGATQLLKLQYPELPFDAFCNKKPAKTGIIPKLLRAFDLPFEWSGYLDGVVRFERKNLPSRLALKKQRLKCLIFRSYRFIKKGLAFIKPPLVTS